MTSRQKIDQAITTLKLPQPYDGALRSFAKDHSPLVTADFIRATKGGVETIQRRLASKDDEISSLETRLASAKDRKSSLNDQATAVKNTVKQLNEDIEAKKTYRDTQTDRAEKNYLKSDYNRYKSEFDRLKNEYNGAFESYTKEFDAQQERAAKITTDFAKASADVINLESELRQARSDRADMGVAADRQTTMLGSLLADSLDIASRSADTKALAKGLGVVSQLAIDGQFGNYDTKTNLRMARNALNLGATVGGDYFDRMDSFYKAGKQHIADPLQSTATTGRLNATGANYTRALAKAMVTSEGTVNMTSSDTVKLLDNLHFHPDNIFTPLNAVVGRIEKFRSLTTDVSSALGTVTTPSSANASTLVRSTLGLPTSTVVDKQLAQTAVVSAMISPFAQGQVGSCFATGPCRKEFEINPQQVLRDLVGIVNNGTLTKPGRDPMPAITRLGDTQGENALLRSWEYSTTTLGARLENAQEMTHFQDALFGNYGSQSANRNFTLRYLESRLPGNWTTNQATMKQAIANSFTFRYDPTLSRSGASDGSSDRGAFVMQHRSASGLVDITTPQQFSQALGDTLVTALGATGTTATTIRQLAGSSNLQTALGPAYRDGTNQSWPWQLEGGGRSNDVIRVLTQTTPTKQSITTAASSADQLLTKLVDTLKNKSDTFISISTEGIHSMNALPNHASLAALKEGGDVPGKVQSLLVNKGRELATSSISAEKSAELFASAVARFGSNDEFGAIATNLPTAGLTPAQLKQRIQQYARAATDDQVNSFLLKSLNFPQFVIADTNWGSATGQINMTVAPDPTTGAARLWKQDAFSGEVTSLPSTWLDASWAFLA